MGERVRPIKITKDFIKFSSGSCLFEMGNTKALCVASIIEGSVPPHAESQKIGWITAEYSMLPGSTTVRTPRQKTLTSGRTYEIQRIIGRALRAAVNLDKIPHYTVYLDCDILQADGGTRTAAINGAFIAMVDAIWKIKIKENIKENIVRNYLGAVSVGIVNGKTSIDLTSAEDNIAEVDMNIVMLDTGEIVEIQATSEKMPLTKEKLAELIVLAESGIKEIITQIKPVVGILP